VSGEFTVEESTALLYYIFPNYPDLTDERSPELDITEWLRQYRRSHEESR